MNSLVKVSWWFLYLCLFGALVAAFRGDSDVAWILLVLGFAAIATTWVLSFLDSKLITPQFAMFGALVALILCALMGTATLVDAKPKAKYTCVNGKVHVNGVLYRDSKGRTHSCNQPLKRK